MGLVTISGQPGCRTEEVARITAHRLGFELVTESRLTALLPEEFGNTGPGADTTHRPSWRHQLTAAQAKPFEPAAFLKGSDGWNPVAEAARLP